MNERPSVDDWAKGIIASAVFVLFSFCLIGAPLSILVADWLGEWFRWPAAWAGATVLPLIVGTIAWREDRS